MKRFFFKNARLIDGTRAPAVENGMLVTEIPEKQGQDGKILYAGEAQNCEIKPDPEDKIVDLNGYSLLPGLFNCHVHLWLSSTKPAFKADHLGVPFRTLMFYRNTLESLIAGTTSMRTVGGSDDIDIALRSALSKGFVWGSRMITCGPPIEPHGGHCWITWGTVECSGPDEFVRAARREIGKGVDQIKLMYSGGAGGGAEEGMYDTHITDEEAAAVCKVAHMRGKKVVAHLSNDNAIRSALNAGVDSIEHAYSMNEETAKMMADKGAYFVPTMHVTGAAKYWPKQAPGSRYEAVQKRLLAAHEKHVEGLQYAMKHGVKICVGTDCLPAMSTDGAFSTMREIMLLVEAGMTPLEAIKAGTANSAELCEMDKMTGHLENGLFGDLTVFKGKPDVDINDLKNLSMVVKGGRVVWSEVPGFEKERSFDALPQNGSPTDGLGNMFG